MKMKYKIVDDEVVFKAVDDKSKAKWGVDDPYPLLKELNKPDGYKIERVKL